MASKYKGYRKRKRRYNTAKNRKGDKMLNAVHHRNDDGGISETLAMIQRSRARRAHNITNNSEDYAPIKSRTKTAAIKTSLSNEKRQSKLSLREKNICKERPSPRRGKGPGSGLSRKFVPWCDRKK